MGPEHKNLSVQNDLLSRLQTEIRSLDTDLMVEEAALGDFKRSASKAFMGLKFGALLDCCQKGIVRFSDPRSNLLLIVFRLQLTLET